MDTIINRAGVKCVFWTIQNELTIEALKEEVDILGKELFEEDFLRLRKQGFPYDMCDGISYVPNEILEADLEANCMQPYSFKH